MKTALITGATSGIGEEFARQLSDMGYALILTGRRVDRLRSLKEELKTSVRIIAADLEKEEECFALLEKIKNVRLDLFINNAGFGACGAFTDIPVDKEISMIRVNDIAMHILFKGVLSRMVDKNHGRIINVASSAGLLPGGPYMATYYATKAYVVSLTRAVNVELSEKKSKVFVCALCPGPVDTQFNDRAEVKFSLPGISAKQCVSEAISGLWKRKTIIVPSLTMKAACASQGLCPERLLLKLVGRQQKKKI